MEGYSEAPHQSSASESTSFDGANQGGEVNDFRGLFERTSQELEQTKGETSKLRNELSQIKGESEKSSKALDSIRRSLMGESESGKEASDPYQAKISELESEMDYYLNAAIEAERKGVPIPLTTKTALDSLKHRIEYLQDKRELEAERKELKEKIKQLSNPANTIDQTAYSNMDSQIYSAVESIYGPKDGMIKQSQFKAISGQIADEIRSIQSEDPVLWDRIRRDRNAQVKLVNHFVKQNIPPAARQLLERDQIQRTPLSHDELMSAWKEASELSKTDPKFVKIAKDLREQLIGNLWAKNAGRGSRASYNDLYQE